MSIRSSVRSFSIVALLLGTTSLALARNPPALAQAQASQDRAASAAGYRDALARHAGDGAETGRRSAGYRDSLTRFVVRTPPVRIASTR